MIYEKIIESWIRFHIHKSGRGKEKKFEIYYPIANLYYIIVYITYLP